MSPLSLSLRLLQSQPDRKLVALCRAGQEPAFEALVRRYRRELLEYSRRLNRADEAPEDVLQQALLQAWQALAAGTEVRDVRAWLYRIVHNVAVSGLRAARSATGELAHPVPSAGVEQLVEQRIEARAALAGLAELPELQRQAMLSTALGGSSHDEVAAALGLSSDSVRGLIYRARLKLRAAVATIIPSPLVMWAVRRGHERPRAQTLYELIAGGGGGTVGVAGAMLKGGVVVSLAGAVAGAGTILAGGALRPHPLRHVAASHHHRDAGRLGTALVASNAAADASGVAAPRRVSARLEASGASAARPLLQRAPSSERTSTSSERAPTSSDSRERRRPSDGHATSGDGQRSASSHGDGAQRSDGATTSTDTPSPSPTTTTSTDTTTTSSSDTTTTSSSDTTTTSSSDTTTTGSQTTTTATPDQ